MQYMRYAVDRILLRLAAFALVVGGILASQGEYRFLLATCGVIGLFVGHQRWTRVRRNRILRKWASSFGLQYECARAKALRSEYADLHALGSGMRWCAFNVFGGQAHSTKGMPVRPVRLFDYRHATGAGRTYKETMLSAVVVDADAPLKPMYIRPEGWFDAAEALFGGGDIDFELTQFSDAYHVTAPDRRWAYDVLNQRTIEFLLKFPRFNIEMSERHLVVCGDHIFSPAEFAQAIAVAYGILDGIPRDPSGARDRGTGDAEGRGPGVRGDGVRGF